MVPFNFKNSDPALFYARKFWPRLWTNLYISPLNDHLPIKMASKCSRLLTLINYALELV